MIALDYVKQRAEQDARAHGYFLNPDPAFLKDLLDGLKKNEERYGYPSCPCRVATGNYALDRDIVCPCDYRDPDVAEYGSCFCCLYVDKKIHDSKMTKPIPERRLAEKIFQEPAARKGQTASATQQSPAMKLWYCRQCGYVAFREEPPYICPICRAKKEFFNELKMRFNSG